MQATLSLESTPAIGVPMRFFLTAPLFGMAAGCLMIYSGPSLFETRWSPAALALTHLITAGFVLQSVLGSLQQLLPVVAGASIARAPRVAGLVHTTITPGALCLVAAFLVPWPPLFTIAASLLCIGVGGFIVAAALALHRTQTKSHVVFGLRLALSGLGVTVSLGALLALSLDWSLTLPLALLTNLHLTWGFVGWGLITVGSVALTVVPMFQQTPAYPHWFAGSFAVSASTSVLLWSAADWLGWEPLASTLAAGIVLIAAALAVMTLHLQQRSRRARRDTTGRLWFLAMLCTVTACAVWMAAAWFAPFGAWRGWPMLLGVLVLFGGFTSVIIGMMYKIVPFLVWLHLREHGEGRLIAPNMKIVLAQHQIDRQAISHYLSLTLLLSAVIWPTWFTQAAGAGLIVSNGWLLRNLLACAAVYRNHMAKLKKLAH
jgi:hypothetical protein